MADYLLGYVADLQLSNVWVVEQRHRAQMFFVQDDWKVNAQLSLNLGLRYDFITPALEANNAQTNFNPAGSGSLVFAKDGSLEDRGLVKPGQQQLRAARRRSSTSSTTRRSLRGGWGIFYNLFDRVGSEDQLALNLPGLVNNDDHADRPARRCSSCSNGFPGELPRRRRTSIQPPGSCSALRLRAVDQDAPKTTTHQASVGLQRESRPAMVLSARLRLHQGDEPGDARQPESAAAERRRQQRARRRCRIPNFGFIEWRAQNGKSEYKGVDLGLEKRFVARLRLRRRPTRWATRRTTRPSS